MNNDYNFNDFSFDKTNTIEENLFLDWSKKKIKPKKTKK